MVLGQIVAILMVNKHMKFHKICFSTFKVIVKVKLCHNDNDNNNNYAAAADTSDDNTSTFFFEKQPS